MVLFLFSLFIFYLSIFLYLKYANPPKAIIAITKAITITVLPACGNAVGLCELLVFCTPFPVFPLFTLLTLPLIKVFTGKVSAQSAKRRLGVHISGFAGAVVLCLLVAMSNSSVFAAGEVATITGTIAQGLGFLAASLSTGFSALGAGIAVAAAAPAAIGAFSENEKNFGKSLIFVALGEGVAIYGLLISILIINKI